MPLRRSSKNRQPRRADAHINPRRFAPPFPASRTGGPPPPSPRPIVEDIESLAGKRWTWSDHALQRCADRGIGVFEALSAVYAPDWTCGNDKGQVQAIRGDVEVVYDPETSLIVTVIDRLEDARPTPRQPVTPPVSAPPALLADPAPPPMEEPPMTPQPAPAPDFYVGPGTAAAAIVSYLAGRAAGETIRRQDMFAAITGHRRTALDVAIRRLAGAGLLRHIGSPRSGTYRLLQAGADIAASHAGAVVPPPPRPPAPGPAAPPAPAAVSPPADTAARTVGATTLEFEFADPPQGDPSERDVSLNHLTSVVVRLKENPGRWARVMLIEGSRQVAGNRVAYLRRQLANPDVELRTWPLDKPRLHGIFACYRDHG